MTSPIPSRSPISLAEGYQPPIPLGISPPPSPRPLSCEWTPKLEPIEEINEVYEATPADMQAALDDWQEKLYEDYMRRLAAEAKCKMLARVKKNG